jgi:hypothetical protein
MRKGFSGIHHVIAGTSNPQSKIDFHISILGTLNSRINCKMTLDKKIKCIKSWMLGREKHLTASH